MVKYSIIAVEGNHDQALVSNLLKLLGLKKIDGNESNLDHFWKKFIPTYPNNGKLYTRLNMPSILFNDSLSVAIYVGKGSNLAENLDDTFCIYPEYQTDITAFGIIADADKNTPEKVVAEYRERLKESFPNFPEQPGVVDQNIPRTGIYVLPDNLSKGVLDTLLCECGEIAYPEYMKRAKLYLDNFSEEEKKSKPLKWKPFDDKKALIATIVSVLKPGKTNTTSIADNDWVSNKTIEEVESLKKLRKFLIDLL
ncbi:MAG: hypothetical protein F6K18_32670 [Okeania sp. SIO2C2]|uniref:DUF3226 domain-containing protein n=1 Tax=Okeania sp. SIO2C2 TaxID=2607787 RepID=UPI0013B8D1CA|nr:DUF3226 domain-containing protein [Okeania sp. SIO2C2]NEP91175.1 hypothetical protein [Okeania sp. SIO2C2]